MANRWGNSGNSDRLYFGGLKITLDGDCSHEIIWHLLLGKKSYDQARHHIKKQRHYFADKGPSNQRYGFPSSHYGCESWTIKKAERRRIDAFELWCWRRLLRVPWTARRSNQSILRKTSPEYSLEGLRLNLKLQYSATWCKEPTHWKRPWCWERLRAGGEGDDRGWDGWMASQTQQTWVWVNSGCWWWTGRPGLLQPMGLHSQTRLSDWAEALNNRQQENVGSQQKKIPHIHRQRRSPSKMIGGWNLI